MQIVTHGTHCYKVLFGLIGFQKGLETSLNVNILRGQKCILGVNLPSSGQKPATRCLGLDEFSLWIVIQSYGQKGSLLHFPMKHQLLATIGDHSLDCAGLIKLDCKLFGGGTVSHSLFGQ